MHLALLRAGLILVLASALSSLGVLAAAPRQWSDESGIFRIEGELVAVRNGKVILEKPDGSIVTIPLEKLSAADREYLKSLDSRTPAQPQSAPKSPEPAAAKPATPTEPASAPAAAAASVSTVLPATDPEAVALAKQVKTVFETNCHRCHGQEGASEGGFNFVLNLEKVARTLVKPRNPGGSLLFERISAAGENVMPPEGETPRPSATDIAVIKKWIEAGAPAPPIEKPRQFISNDDMLRHMLADVRNVAERSRKFIRYFTLTHLYNAGVSEDELQTYRNAFVKLINSLSWNSTLLIPEPIDPARTIFRVDIRHVKWTSEVWEVIAAANPYFLPLSTPDALACNDATETKVPYVRIDWFVFAGSKPPLYHLVLGVPPTDRLMELLLRVNVPANIKQEEAIRAAFNRSGVSQNNRLIEWHKSPHGSYWKSYDFASSVDRQNIFEHPLGPGPEAESFKHDGGEIIFTLPNGLQGYLLVDGQGKRIDQGPTNIVSDPKQPSRSVVNGVSCMSCHYAGVIPKGDEVGGAVRANPKAFANSADILALYREPKELDQIFEEDAGRFAAALKKIGIQSISRSGEPISAMAQCFQQEIDLPMAACEFGLSGDEFLRRLDSTDTVARAYSPLRVPGGTIKREVFVASFGKAAVEMRLVSEIVRPAAPALKSSSSRAAPTTTPTATAVTARPSASAEAVKPGEVRRFKEMGWGIKSLAFSPTGGWLAAGKQDRALLMLDVVSTSRIESLNKLEILGQVSSCTFAANGTKLIAGGSTGHIQIYDISKTGLLKESGQFAGHSQEVSCLAVSGDGRFAVSGGSEKKLRYWEVSGGRELGVFAGFEGSIKACFIAKNGSIAMATDGATLQIIDLGAREVLAKRQLNDSWAAGQAAAFSADGDRVAASDGRKIRVWSLDGGGELPKLEDNDLVWTLAFTPDGTRLISGGRGKINVWDVAKQSKIHSLATAGTGYVQTIGVSPDNRHVAAIPSSAGQDLQVFRIPAVEK